MRECFLAIQSACRERRHIQAILPAEPVGVLLEGEKQTWILMVNQQGVDFSPDVSGKWQLRLRGKEESLAELLAGEQQLRFQLRLGEVEMTGLYRFQLWFESFVWLCRSYKNSA
ncbi:hypothetical protein [Bacillus xiapuensis]|uniref:hypothetical protein n=1 Tax=Bacillus xiapuensis TaxID=2014075 RepID=UPI000C2469EE|nr:hypothetical protein [Bacillus xiapuensis]